MIVTVDELSVTCYAVVIRPDDPVGDVGFEVKFFVSIEPARAYARRLRAFLKQNNIGERGE